LLRDRLITAAIALPLLIWAVFWGPMWVYQTIVLSLTFIALREFAAMSCNGVPHGVTMVTVGGMLVAFTMGFGASSEWISAALVTVLASVLIGTLATATDMRKSVVAAGQILLGALYGGMLLPHFIWVRNLPSGAGWVCLVIACVMAGDAGGYFGGRMFGRRKLWPTVSPKKTVEGAAAAFVCTLIVGVLANWIVLGSQMGAVEVLAVSGAISILAQLGDLLESMLKRAYDAKDSGWIFPGHGGVLDRTDSLVLPIVFVYYYAMLGHGAVAQL
jgi:phosphatidate cytidylyltransferase